MLLLALQSHIKRYYKDKWSHYTIVKFKSLQMFQIFCHSPSNTISLTFFVEYIWATSRENLSLEGCEHKGTDQPAHLCSLVSAYVIRLLESTISRLISSEISCFRLVSVAEQASLNLIQSPRRQGFSRLGP